MPNTHAFDLFKSLEAAIEAAHAGASVLRSYHQRRTDLIIDRKARNDFVSQADKEAELMIIQRLQHATPHIGLVAEESGGTPNNDLNWIIDPLDGTTNYLHGIPHYAVSIGLVGKAGLKLPYGEVLEHDTPLVGVVYDPCREEMFTAVQGVGAWLNSHRIRCSQTPVLEDALLATGFPFSDLSFTQSYSSMLNRAFQHTQGVRRNGAAALDLAWVACGRFDGYWELRLKPWDVAAGALLVREAGGLCEDPYGRHAWPMEGNVVAAGKALLPALQAMIAPELEHTPPLPL